MINDLSFNTDYSSISVSTDEGHMIFNCEPFGRIYSSQDAPLKRSLSNSLDADPFSSADKDSIGAGIEAENREEHEGEQDQTRDTATAKSDNNNVDQTHLPTLLLKMLFSTSLTIIVPKGNDNCILTVYNLKQNLKIMDLKFISSIVDVKLNRKRLLVMLVNGEVHIYDLSCIKLLKVLFLQKEEAVRSGSFVGDLSVRDDSWLVLPLSLVNEQILKDKGEIWEGDNESGQQTERSSKSAKHQSKDTDSSEKDTGYCLQKYLAITPKNSQNKDFTAKRPITLKDLRKDGNGWVLVYDTIKLEPIIIFKAHDSSIAKITISHKDRKIATASIKGTIVRVFQMEEQEEGGSTEIRGEKDGNRHRIELVKNLRRGHNVSKIKSMSFSSDESILGCASESNTIHLFDLTSDGGIETDSSGGHGFNDRGNDDSYYSDHDHSDTEAYRSSSEDLNESLANLLLSRPPDSTSKPNTNEGDHSVNTAAVFNTTTTKSKKSWFGKTKDKLIDNHYTNSILKKIPYRDYLDNLIWEPPRRSYAYIKVPEQSQSNNLEENCSKSPTVMHQNKQKDSNKYSIGFSADSIFVASYASGLFYQYQIPPKHRRGSIAYSSLRAGSDEQGNKREKCKLINEYSLV